MQFIDLKRQYQRIETGVLQSIKKVLEHGQYIMGPEIAELEKKLADFVGVKHAIVNASGTDALIMALMALEIEPGDEIITSPFSFFATAEVIALLKATPVFVDIDRKTYNLNPLQLERAITPKTKAIMPVSLFGQCAQLTTINEIAKKYGLPVVEDAAQSFGALHQGGYSGGLTTIGCTSFFPSKPLGGYGDSGACFTDDDILAERLKEIRLHGQHARYLHRRIGITGRMDTLQAAILLEKLKLFPREIELRQELGQRYSDLLADSVKTPYIESGNTSVYAQFTIEVEERELFQQAMQKLGIPTAIHYPLPLYKQEALSGLAVCETQYPVTEEVCKKVISLPMHPYLQEEELFFVVNAVKKCTQPLAMAV